MVNKKAKKFSSDAVDNTSKIMFVYNHAQSRWRRKGGHSPND